MKTQRGLSLIEMLVALTISMTLMSGVLAIMSTTKKTSALQNELSRLQEDARFLIEDLSYNVRMAGYFGCSGLMWPGFVKPKPILVNNNAQLQDIDGNAVSKSTPYSDVLTVSHLAVNGKLRLDYPAAQGIVSTTNVCDCNTPTPGTPGTLVCNDSTNVLPGSCLSSGVTDINLCQQIVSEKNYIKTQQCAQTGFSTANSTIQLHSESSTPVVNDTLIMADCSGAEPYQVANVSGSPPLVTVSTRLSKYYFWPVEVFHVPVIADRPTIEQRLQVTYQVRAIDKDGDGKATDPIDGFALFKNNQLFIEGVESLQIRYGIDTNSDDVVDRYVEATGTPIGPIISVRINILMRTGNKRFDLTGATDRSFDLDPDMGTYNPNDDDNLENEEGYRHRLFTTTIRVRNS
ncbi:PilW family protein [Candidatus Albibeggiatoa sp. nov. BB20]|uniref:PilW family protein n=1 Tax=Candidatus Albibeggiatoa sp. nov. BB20 TaxID=3162723 RepID=UPI00336549A3